MTRRWWAVRERLSWPLVWLELTAHRVVPSRRVHATRFAFGPAPEQHVIMFGRRGLPADAPLVYFLHGGSWRYGSPSFLTGVGRHLARQGYRVALGGYRLAPGHRFPAQRDDVFAGLAATLDRVGDTQRVVLAGQSAGAHLAALAAFDDESRAAAGLGGLALAGVLLVSGPLDFEVMCPGTYACPLVRDLMGGVSGWEAADPVRFVHHAARVPVLCVHGSRDPLVPVEVSASFVMRANGAEGDHATFVADPRGHHADLTGALLGRSRVAATIAGWLADVTAP